RKAQKACEAALDASRELLRRARPNGTGLEVDGKPLTSERLKRVIEDVFADDEVKEWYRLVKEALDSSTAGVKPGVNGRSLYEGVCEIFHGAGYKTQLNKDPGEVLEDGFFHGLGHGVGLDVHELPSM